MPPSVFSLTSGAGGSIATRNLRPFLLGMLLLLSLAVYLIILVRSRATTMAAPRWLDLATFAVALAAMIAYGLGNRNGGKMPSLGPTVTVHSAYFKLVVLGVAVALVRIVLGLHRESIDTTASLLQASAWLMTTLLAFVAARNHQAQQAKQWLTRSVAIAISYVVLPLLPHLTRYPRLHEDGAGLQKGIVVFAALLIADIKLNWREITTSRT